MKPSDYNYSFASLLVLAFVLALVAPFSQAKTVTKVEVVAPTYPRTITLPEGEVKIHMPQVLTWEKYETLVAWTVVEVIPTGSKKRWIGTVKLKAQSDIDFNERLVVIYNIEAVERKFHDDITPPASVLNIAKAAVSLKPRSVPLDVVLRALPADFQTSRAKPGPATQLKHDPPKIFVATKPTALMLINGEPIRASIANTQLEYVVNTNWDLFYDKDSERYYTLNGTTWQYSKSLLKPKWKTTTKLPDDLTKLPDDANWQAVKKHLPAKKTKAKPPKILVSFEPAELILIDGKPQFYPIKDSGIDYLTNSGSDVFRYDKHYYYLVSGRWFKAKKLKGDWEPVEDLPKAFARIPEQHAKSHVLAAVPGTPAARAALIEASIPRKANISPEAGAGINVVYDGEPRFVPIENTNMKRAANTQYQVIQVKDRYYLCHNAVWFTSTSATGPWEVATSVPDVIYTIPASDPAHNTTYVYVDQDPQPSTHITYAYTSGYYGYYPYGSTVVYGSGWYYPPYYYYNPYGYPAYWYYPPSYGYGSYYNPTTGRYGERAVAYGPYGGAAAGAVYNPRTGTYARGETVWDSDEVARSGYAYNPNTNAYAAGNMYYDFDDNEGWREGYVQRGDRWVYGETTLDGNTARTEFETARGATGTSTRVRNEDSITGSGTINYKDRSAQTASKIDSEGAQIDIKGDKGGTATITKEYGAEGAKGEITTADGRTAELQSQLTEQGRKTDITGAGGGRASTIVNQSGRTTVGKSQSGDLYAGRDGNVYKRNDQGNWSRYQNGSWQDVSRPQRPGSSPAVQNYSRSSSGLNRHYSARQQGVRNYGQYQSIRSSAGRMRSGRRGRR